VLAALAGVRPAGGGEAGGTVHRHPASAPQQREASL
jgi:hypothetical protein